MEEPETFVAALFASAAISTFVLPIRIGESVYADGGWVRNFPLAYAYREPAVQRIVGCRYRASASGFAGRGLNSLHSRISRLARIRVARGVEVELREAIERQERGEPMHLVDTIARLSHIAVYRNSDLEVQLADERDRSLQALHDVRERMRDCDRFLQSRWPAHGAPGRAGRGLLLGRIPVRARPRRATARGRRLDTGSGSGSMCPAAACRGATRRSWRSSPTGSG